MRPDVDRDYQWQRRYIPELKRIVGEHLIGEAPAAEDAERNTDLIVLRLEAVRIACRVRTPGYANGYLNEFTIRASRPSGARTELAKIIEGWGDYILYAFASDDDHLGAWTLGNLNVFRVWHSTCLVNNSGQLPGILKSNHDNSSDFRVYRISELPGEFVTAFSRPVLCAA